MIFYRSTNTELVLMLYINRKKFRSRLMGEWKAVSWECSWMWRQYCLQYSVVLAGIEGWLKSRPWVPCRLCEKEWLPQGQALRNEGVCFDCLGKEKINDL